MNKSVGKAGILIAILVIPALVFLFLKFFATNHWELPHLVPKFDEKGQVMMIGKDTVFHKIPDFNLTDENGKPFTQKEVEGKIHVADFFFTRCTTICPKMTNQLGRVQGKFSKNPEIKLVSYSVDPSNDTPEILKAYAKKREANEGQWYFVTGDKKALYKLGLEGYKLSVADASQYDKKVSVDETFIHSEKMVLVDKEGHIRGFYDGTNEQDVDRLIVEIQILLDIYSKKNERN